MKDSIGWNRVDLNEMIYKLYHVLTKIQPWTQSVSHDMSFPTMWYVWPAKPQISLPIWAVWSEPLLVAWIFYVC